MKAYYVEGRVRQKAWWGIILFCLALITAVIEGIDPLIDLFPTPLQKFITSFGLMESSFKDAIFMANATLGIILLPIAWGLFDKWIWRAGWQLKGPFNIINRFFGIPNFNGDWVGVLHRDRFISKDEYQDGRIPEIDEMSETSIPVILYIRQSYFFISIELENMIEESMSGSTLSHNDIVGFKGDFDSYFTINFSFTVGGRMGCNVLEHKIDQDREYLCGDYVSSVPRTGSLDVRRLRKKQTLIKAEIKILKSSEGETYLGAIIGKRYIDRHLKQLKKLNRIGYQKMMANRRERDGDAYHITVISPPEYEQIEDVDYVTNKIAAFAVMELGTVRKDGAVSYFVTVFSPHVDYLRAQIGLGSKDYHITLGFAPHDIHDHPKHEDTWVKF